MKLRTYHDCALEREAVVTEISRVRSIGDIGPKHLEALDKARRVLTGRDMTTLEEAGGGASVVIVGVLEDISRDENLKSSWLIVLAGEGGNGGSGFSNMRNDTPFEPPNILQWKQNTRRKPCVSSAPKWKHVQVAKLHTKLHSHQVKFLSPWTVRALE